MKTMEEILKEANMDNLVCGFANVEQHLWDRAKKVIPVVHNPESRYFQKNPSEYNQDVIDIYTGYIKILEEGSSKEKRKHMRKYFKERLEYFTKLYEGDVETFEHISKFCDGVENWEVPTKDHTEFKEVVLKELQRRRGWYSDTVKKLKPSVEYYTDLLSKDSSYDYEKQIQARLESNKEMRQTLQEEQDKMVSERPYWTNWYNTLLEHLATKEPAYSEEELLRSWDKPKKGLLQKIFGGK